MDINIINAEALVVGPDEVLILRLDPELMPDDFDDQDAMMKALVEELTANGLKGRSLVFVGDVEFTKVKRESSPGIAADYADSAE